jgi:hypothetical protein
MQRTIVLSIHNVVTKYIKNFANLVLLYSYNNLERLIYFMKQELLALIETLSEGEIEYLYEFASQLFQPHN